MLEQGDKNQNARAVPGREDLFFQKCLRCPAFNAAVERFMTDQEAGDRIEATNDPADDEAELQPYQHPEIVGCPPAPEAPNRKGSEQSANGSADQRRLPAQLRVGIAAFSHVDHELAGRLALRGDRRGPDGFSVRLRKEPVDSPRHGGS